MLEFWYAALRSEHGVVIQCDGDPEKVRQRLYRLRSEVQDADLDSLSICASPTEASQLWIVKREK